MKKKETPFLDFYRKCMANLRLPEEGLCDSLGNPDDLQPFYQYHPVPPLTKNYNPLNLMDTINSKENQTGKGHQVLHDVKALEFIRTQLESASCSLNELGLGSDAVAALNHIALAIEEVGSLAYGAEEALNQNV